MGSTTGSGWQSKGELKKQLWSCESFYGGRPGVAGICPEQQAAVAAGSWAEGCAAAVAAAATARSRAGRDCAEQRGEGRGFVGRGRKQGEREKEEGYKCEGVGNYD